MTLPPMDQVLVDDGILAGMFFVDLGGTIYMHDGRVIDRAPGQSEVDAILGLPAMPLLEGPE